MVGGKETPPSCNLSEGVVVGGKETPSVSQFK